MEKKNKCIKNRSFRDPSSAAFFCALTLMKKNSMKILNVGLNPTRTGFYQLLKNMVLISNLKT